MKEKKSQINDNDLQLYKDSKWYNEFMNQEYFMLLVLSDIPNMVSIPIIESPELIDYIYNFLKTSDRVGLINDQIISNIHVIINTNLYTNYTLTNESRNKCLEVLKMLEYIEYGDAALARIEREFASRTIIEDCIKVDFNNPKEILEVLYDSYYSDYLLYQTLYQYEIYENLNVENYKSLIVSKGSILSIVSIINNYEDILNDNEIKLLSEILNYKLQLKSENKRSFELKGYSNVDTGEKIVLTLSEDELKLINNQFEDEIIYKLIDILNSKPNKTYILSNVLS